MLAPDAILSAIRALAESRPGFEPANYSDRASYMGDVRAATNALHDVREMLRYIEWRTSSHVQICTALADTVNSQRGRVSAYGDGKLEYTAGQYYCVEFRPAIARLLADAIWRTWLEDMLSGTDTPTGDKIRARARRTFSRRVARRYFDA